MIIYCTIRVNFRDFDKIDFSNKGSVLTMRFDPSNIDQQISISKNEIKYIQSRLSELQDKK